jgi:hypothetical protein
MTTTVDGTTGPPALGLGAERWWPSGASSAEVENASKEAAGQWRNWWWVAVGGEVVFIPLIFLMTGRWDPRRARRDAARHEQRVQEELAALKS